MRSIFLACVCVSRCVKSVRQKLVVRSLSKARRDIAAAIVSLLSAGLFALLLSGCAEAYYVDTNHTPEARYDTYYGPDYYPYYPYYSYYGGAYYYEY